MEILRSTKLLYHEDVMIRINICGESQTFIGNVREHAAAVGQLILLKSVKRFPA
jgi:hypothetical protein